MKWKNKGHELDVLAEKLVKRFQDRQEKIYIFGAGVLGRGIVPAFERYQCFAGFIDNDARKQAEGFYGRSVLSPAQYVKEGASGFVIIAADKRNIPSMQKQMEEIGLAKGKDFWTYKEFMHDIFPVLSFYWYHLSYVDLAQICLTERCTLKCRDCAHGCFAVDSKSQDMSLEMAMESADAFFSVVDVVREFVLIGGEPFLYRNLAQIISYIGERYRDKILIFSITTNGTIMPAAEILELCRKYGVLVRISNYSGTIKRLEAVYGQLTDRLETYKVAYLLGEKAAMWMDYGFGSVEREEEEKELICVFDKCKTPCREVRGHRYYYCVMARSVSENMGFCIGEEDYLDLDVLESSDKKVLLEFEYGFSEKGYLEMCRHCHGADAAKHPIPAAEQLDH